MSFDNTIPFIIPPTSSSLPPLSAGDMLGAMLFKAADGDILDDIAKIYGGGWHFPPTPQEHRGNGKGKATLRPSPSSDLDHDSLTKACAHNEYWTAEAGIRIAVGTAAAVAASKKTDGDDRGDSRATYDPAPGVGVEGLRRWRVETRGPAAGKGDDSVAVDWHSHVPSKRTHDGQVCGAVGAAVPSGSSICGARVDEAESGAYECNAKRARRLGTDEYSRRNSDFDINSTGESEFGCSSDGSGGGGRAFSIPSRVGGSPLASSTPTSGKADTLGGGGGVARNGDLLATTIGIDDDGVLAAGGAADVPDGGVSPYKYVSAKANGGTVVGSLSAEQAAKLSACGRNNGDDDDQDEVLREWERSHEGKHDKDTSEEYCPGPFSGSFSRLGGCAGADAGAGAGAASRSGPCQGIEYIYVPRTGAGASLNAGACGTGRNLKRARVDSER